MKVPSTPVELGFNAKTFPAWREGQKELIEVAANSTYSNILISAPPGFGKSLFAAGLIEVMGGKAQYLVTTKSLQHQINDEFSYIFSMSGRNNYKCVLPGHTKKSVDQAPCASGYSCPLKLTECPYYLTRKSAYETRVLVTNYSWYFNNNEYSFPPLPMPNLLICDEADTVESAIMSYATISITADDAYELGLTLPNPANMTKWLGSAKSQIQFVIEDAKENFYKKAGTKFDPALIQPDDDFTLSTAFRLTKAERLATTVERMENGWNNHADLYVIDSSPHEFTIRPIVATIDADALIHSRAPKRVYMSATILDKDGFCRELGLNPAHTLYLEAESSFPKENRPFILHNRGKLNNKTLAASMPDIVEWVDSLIEHYGSKKGIVHTTNYAIANYLLKNSSYRELMVGHQSHNRALAIKHFKHQSASSVIVSPSLVRGEDFPGHHAEWQAIIKAPYPNIADPQIKARMALDDQWVTRVALRNLIQAYGRGNRKESDVCHTHVYDSNVGALLERAKKSVPKYVKEAVLNY